MTSLPSASGSCRRYGRWSVSHARNGIGSGQVIAGYTGTARRATYTCVGDTVNLAAHLEAHTKVLGRPILIDEHTRAGLGDVFRVENHGAVQFKTRAQSVRVYSVVPGG